MTRAQAEIADTFDFDEEEGGFDLVALLAPAMRHWVAILVMAVAAGAAGFGVSRLITPQFTAATAFLSPQPPQSGAASALASLGALGSLAGGSSSGKNSPDEYIALLQSDTVSDRIIKRFGLRELWNDRYQVDARKHLMGRVTISAGKKDGLMHVTVVDPDPQRAAAMANQYVDELRTLTTVLAVTEAQQRRVFFERLLEQTKDKLSAAQSMLESSGYSAGALNSQPATAAEGYARIQAQLTSEEVKLQVLHKQFSDDAPEIQRQRETVNALTSQLARIEAQDQGHSKSTDYVNRYREFKYQETLFDLFARQYENARVDESREGTLIQVLDPATPPERKSSPSGLIFTLVGAALGFVVATALYALRARRVAVPA